MYENHLNHAIEAAKLAAKEIVKIYNSSFDVEIKSDDSPVTNADKLADKIISDYLRKYYRDYGFLTEESTDDYSRLEKDYVWIIDPIDGTKEFINKNEQFNTNIALSYKGEIVLGLIYIPLKDEYYYALKGNGAYYYNGKDIIRINVNNKTKDLICLTSQFHQNVEEDAIIERNKDKIKQCIKVGAALKACIIAKGDAEISYRMSKNTKEWDTAPMQIILEEANGVFLSGKLERIMYNKKDVYNHDGYICANLKENINL